MSNLVTLIKYNILNSFPIISKLNKKKNHSTKALVGLAVLAFLAIFAFITIYMCMIESLFAQAGHSDLILLMGITMSSLMIFFTNFFIYAYCKKAWYIKFVFLFFRFHF